MFLQASIHKIGFWKPAVMICIILNSLEDNKNLMLINMKNFASQTIFQSRIFFLFLSVQISI